MGENEGEGKRGRLVERNREQVRLQQGSLITVKVTDLKVEW